MTFEVRKTAAFDAWLDDLTDTIAKTAIVDRIVRVESGLLGHRRSVGDRVSELKVDVGQGYRLYYTMNGRTVVVLLFGGGKKSQRADIKRAQAMVKKMSGTMKRPGGASVRDRHLPYSAGSGDSEPIITNDDIRISPFDAADYLQDEGAQLYVLRNALASGHPRYIANAIGAVARARGLSNLERETGIKRQTLNKSFSLKGNPTLETLLPVLGALGLRLEIVADRQERATDA